jgi:hypothetical protein
LKTARQWRCHPFVSCHKLDKRRKKDSRIPLDMAREARGWPLTGTAG